MKTIKAVLLERIDKATTVAEMDSISDLIYQGNNWSKEAITAWRLKVRTHKI